MRVTWHNLSALGCGVLYLFFWFLLPVLAVPVIGAGVTGANLLSVSFWSWLPLMAGIALMVCAMLTPPQISGAVCAVCAFVPLLSWFLIRARTVRDAALLGSLPLLRELSGAEVGAVLTVGAGVVLPMILGICAAVFCFLGALRPKTAQRTAGLSAGADDEW